MSREMVARALSSPLDWRILGLLITGRVGMTKISVALGVEDALTKAHLDKLVGAGLVTFDEEPLQGRPAAGAYRLTGASASVGFPPRDYRYLSEAMIDRLRASLGENGARSVLHDIGIRMGEDVAKNLAGKTGSTVWNPTNYAEHFIRGLLAELGFYPKVLKVGSDHVVYQERNCLFQDLAVKQPGLICDVLDAAVHEGMDKKLGDIRTIRRKCIGHGDAVCEFQAR